MKDEKGKNLSAPIRVGLYVRLTEGKKAWLSWMQARLVAAEWFDYESEDGYEYFGGYDDRINEADTG